MQEVMNEFKQYIEQSGIKADILAILDDIDAVQDKINTLEAKIKEVDNNDYAAKLMAAGVPSYNPIFTGNLSVKKQVIEYAQLQEKLKQMKL